MSTELMIPEKLDVPAIFAPDGSKDILDSIEREARSVELDISTHDGRKAVASLAYKISRSKTYLDEQGERLVEEWKKSAKSVDIERKRIRDRLDALRDEIRKPLTDFENKEKERIAGHEEALRLLGAPMLVISRSNSPQEIESHAKHAIMYFQSRQWDEFIDRAGKKYSEVISFLDLMLRESKDRIAKEKELIRLQKEESDRKQRKRDEQLKAQEAERVQRQADTKIQEERERAEQEIRRVREESEKASRLAETILAQQVANHNREKAELEEKLKKKSTAGSQQPKGKGVSEVNRTQIHKEIEDALIADSMLTSRMAKNVIDSIVNNQIPHVKITY
jgi:hypothetical protein